MLKGNHIGLLMVAGMLSAACSGMDTGGRSRASGSKGENGGKEKVDKQSEASAFDAGVDPLPGVETRTNDQILCQEGLKVANRSGEADFSRSFKAICDGDTTNGQYKDILAAAYDGDGEPEVALIESETSSMYVTKLMFAYALKIPIDAPTKVSDLNLYEQFGNIEADNSALQVKVKSRQPFPGDGSVERVVLDYNLALARGAALHDQRTTVIENYLLVERSRDITMSTEHLLDADNNKHYHVAQQLMVGMKGDGGSTILFYLTEMVVKNRIDGDRLKNTLIDLSKSVAKISYETAAEKQ